jgi:hypothetical protein
MVAEEERVGVKNCILLKGKTSGHKFFPLNDFCPCVGMCALLSSQPPPSLLPHHPPVLQPLSTMEDEQPLQSFQRRPVTDYVADIPALTDPKTGERIILWSDIQDAFKNAESIWNGKSLVPFLKDENFER